MDANEIAETVAEFHELYAEAKNLNAKLQGAHYSDRPIIQERLAAIATRNTELTSQMRTHYDEVLAPAHAEAQQRVNDAQSKVLDQQFVLQDLQDDVKRAQAVELAAFQALKSLSRDAGISPPPRPDNRRVGSGQITSRGARASA